MSRWVDKDFVRTRAGIVLLALSAVVLLWVPVAARPLTGRSPSTAGLD